MESGDAAPMTPIGVNLPNDQEIRETYGSKSVSLSNVTEAYEKSTPREYREGVRVEPGRGRSRGAVGGVRRRADDESPRDHRARLGPGVAGAERRAREGAEGAFVGDRGSARRSRRALLRGRPIPRGHRRRSGRVAGRHRARRVRSLRAQRPGAVATDPRGHADRGRPHAQPAADRALAAGEYVGADGVHARQQDVLPR